MEFHQKISMFDCRKLTTMVKRSVDQKLRLRNFDARNERIDIGAVVTSRRGLSGVDRGHGVCYRWKAQEQCPSEDKCSVVLLSRFFSAEHAAVGNEARAERIKFSHCVLMIGVFPFFFIDCTIVRSGIQSIFLELALARRTARTSQTCVTVVSQIRSSCP